MKAQVTLGMAALLLLTACNDRDTGNPPGMETRDAQPSQSPGQPGPTTTDGVPTGVGEPQRPQAEGDAQYRYRKLAIPMAAGSLRPPARHGERRALRGTCAM